MPFDSQGKLICRDTRTIVCDFDQLLSGPDNGDRYVGCSGIQSVFNQFFYNRGRPFNDLAGCDLGGNISGKIRIGMKTL